MFRFLGCGNRPWLALVVLFLLAPGHAAAGEAGGEQRIPETVVRLIGTRQDVPLATALSGRAALVFLTEGGSSAACPVGRAAADLQREHGTRFAWVAVASGAVEAADIERIRDTAPVRLDRVFADRAGSVREALGIARLPVLLLVDETGRIRESCSPDGGAELLAAAARALPSLALPARAVTGLADFRLPLVGGEGLVSFLDVAGEDATLVVFVHSRCLACARELEVLDFARQRHGGRARFVTVFLDPASEARIRGFLGAAGAVPDFVLRDPELRLAAHYGVRSAPSLVVIGAAGELLLSHSGYDEGKRDKLYAGIMAALAEGGRASAADSALAEARRLHEQACAFLREGRPGYALIFQERIRELLPDYPSVHLRIAEAALADGRPELALESLARYLEAKPQTYDSEAVRQRIAGIEVPPP